MTARTLATFALVFALGFCSTVKSDTKQTPDQPADAGEARGFPAPAALKDSTKPASPQTAPAPKSPSCIDSCMAEGWDAEECRQECTWVVEVPGVRLLVSCR